MEKFGLDDLLRHAFAGAVFLITVIVAYHKSLSRLFSELPHLDGSTVLTVGTGAILLCGSLIYVLHRIVYHYAIYRILIPRVWGNPHPSPMTLDLNRFRRRIRTESLQRSMGEWASQVHFLYCVAWAVLLGLLSGIPLFGHLGAYAGWRLLGFAGVILIAAVFHNKRYLAYECEIERQESGATSTP